MNPYPTEHYVEQRASTSSNVVCVLVAASLEFASHYRAPEPVLPPVNPMLRSSTVGQFKNMFARPSISADLPWLATLEMGNRPARSTPDELITTINGLNIILKERNFQLMDAIFRQLDVTKISPEMMIAFIRTTFAAKSKLGEWCQLRDRIRDELSSRRFDPDTLLQGLG